VSAPGEAAPAHAAPGALVARELSAHGRGAIAVIELAGPGALARVRSLARAPRLGERARSFALARLRSAEDELLDEAVVCVESPERVELCLHGSPALVRRVLAELGAAPPAPARTLEERAEEALAASASEAAARMLLDQARGALRRALERLPGLAPAERRVELAALVGRAAVGRALVRPPRVVLRGPVNAGKSTLFNVLVGHERALVDASSGTTRDAVRERARLGAYAVELVDTAGERELGGADDEVERAGQALARRLGAEAELVLYLRPPGAPAPTALPPGALVVHSRADEGRAPEPALSALREPERARAQVSELFHGALRLPRAPWRAGEGVPFVPELAAELAHALDGALDADGAELEARLAPWLARA